MPTNPLFRRLDLTTLQIFLAVYEEGTLTRAAQRESIALSAASKRLLELEEALGTPLLVRQASGMTLTPAGASLLHHARKVLADVEKLGVELAEHAHGVRGHVRVMANLSAIVEFLPEDLRRFLSDNDGVRLDLEERHSAGVIEGVADNLAELGICTGETDLHGLHHELYRRDHLAVVMPKEHPLATRERVAFEETLDSDHVGLHAASSINSRAHSAARLANRPLRMPIHVPGFDAVCRMVQAGMGVGVIPYQAFLALGSPAGLVAVPLADAWAERELLLVVRDVALLSPLGRALFDHLRAHEGVP